MSSRAQRRRTKPSITVKQAFEENENDNKPNTQEISDEYESSLRGHIDLDRFYERAFFTINNVTVEVILNNDILNWSDLSDESYYDGIHRRKVSNRENMNSINLHDVYAISPIYDQCNSLLNTNENQSNMTLRGFQLHTYEIKHDNILQEILIIFQSNLPNQMKQWYRLLSKMISEYKPSRKILVLCNPYTGSRPSRYVYNTKIKPMLDRAHYNVTYFEIDDLCSADEVLSNFEDDFDSFYGLVIIGGDGSVINVINALLRNLAKENRTRLGIEYDLPSLPFPICIIPNGTTNIICQSIHGCTDHCTPILHLLFNHQMKIDMSAIFDANYNFVTANFSAGAGYPANALKYFTRYSNFSPKKTIRKSFAKATSNKNLRSIQVEIRYISADQNSITMTRCCRGCPACNPVAFEQTDDQVKVFDTNHIQKISKRKTPLPSNNDNNNRLLSSSLSKKFSNRQNEEKQHWKILHHNYLQVAILTNANLWSFAPQGLSKFGHLADGLLDLILIEHTTRKDFLRYIKRNGNSKDQFEFSFTKLIKVKELEIELKSSNDYLMNEILNTNNQSDSSSSSDDSSDEEYSNNINRTSFVQRHEPYPPNVPISEDSRRHRRHRLNEQTQQSSKHVFQSSNNMDDSIIHFNNRNQQNKYSENESNNAQINLYNSDISVRRKSIFHSLKLKKDKIPLSRPSSVDIGNVVDQKQNRKNRLLSSGTLRPAKSLLNLLTGGNSSSGKHDQSSNRKQDSSPTTTINNNRRRPSINSRSPSRENERIPTLNNNQYRNRKQPCMWNLDFTPYNSPLIRIKCFYRFLPVFGTGLNPDTMLKEVNYSCFGRIG
ncbi:unnamed protein product [Rotaria sordida]|uniref:DAGKc domain-containing protein n=1 Tax=Rotaria sordida TaxID=392033 RepID=A0A818KFU7_9BILA|nr:unnamed protein product [Rotaria sordida]CAF3550985.1 unnamed protein product [Rotaria sordida]